MKEKKIQTATGMDQSHNIVLPYSWPSPTQLSGPSVQGKVFFILLKLAL